MTKSGYMTRALQSRDPRFAQVLARLGYERRDVVPAKPVPQSPDPQPDDLAALRAEYQNAVGKRPYMGWDAEVLRLKIAAAKSQGDQ